MKDSSPFEPLKKLQWAMYLNSFRQLKRGKNKQTPEKKLFLSQLGLDYLGAENFFPSSFCG